MRSASSTVTPNLGAIEKGLSPYAISYTLGFPIFIRGLDYITLLVVTLGALPFPPVGVLYSVIL